MSESDLYRPIIDAAIASGLAVLWRNQSGKTKVRGGYMQLGPTGSPDLVGWMLRGPFPGRFVGLEVKKPREKPTEAQLEWQARIKASGGVAGVVETVGEAIRILQEATSLY